MDFFVYQRLFWASAFPNPLSAAYAPLNDPMTFIPICLDFKSISLKISRLLPKVQRQIYLDFGDGSNLTGE